MTKEIIIHQAWDSEPPHGGTAVVIDVVRFSTTLCALLKAGRRKIWTAREPKNLIQVKNLSACDIFSEIDFDSKGRRFDNSPSKALEIRSQQRPAYITTTSGSKALCACRQVPKVLVGCFANFDAVLERIRRNRGPLWLIPAALGVTAVRGAPEDNLCAEAFQSVLKGNAHDASDVIRAVRNSPRIAEFLRFRPDGHRDLDMCLTLNCLPIVPEAVFNPSAPESLVRIRKA